MGGKPTIECPRGISLREFRHEVRIQIAFSYRGAECRELLPPCSITKSAVTYAAGLRNEILRKIADGVFVPTDQEHHGQHVDRGEQAQQRGQQASAVRESD